MNAELQNAMKKAGNRKEPPREEVLGHIQSRQAFYRLQRVSRKTMRWGQQQFRVPAFTLPARPKGDITAEYLNDIASMTLRHVRAINKRGGVSEASTAGVLPGMLPGNIFEQLGQSLWRLNQLSTITGARSRQAPAGEDAEPAGKKRRRRR
jgi:hypothetical protein